MKIKRISDATVGYAMAAVLLALWLIVPQVVDDHAEAHKQRADKLERIVISCLQSGVIAIDGTVHECRPVSLGVKL